MSSLAVAETHEMKRSGMDDQEFVTVRVAGQLFGIPVLQVQDVLRGQKRFHVPLSDDFIAGAMNLRGRIVTAIDMYIRLKIVRPEGEAGNSTMSVVVEHKAELYSLEVDVVGDVLTVSPDRVERNPNNMDNTWRDIASGVIKLKEELLVILDVAKLLNL